MFNTYSTSTSPWHTAATSHNRASNSQRPSHSKPSSRSRFNDWTHEDDVENTNEQRTPSNHRENPITNTHSQSFFSWSVGDDSNHINLFSQETPDFTSSPFPAPVVSSPLTQTPFNVQRLPTPPPPLHTTVQIPVPDTLPMAYPVKQSSLYTGSYYSYDGKIYTHKGEHETLGKIEYLTIRDVIRYVTLGKVICDSYIDELTRVVTEEIPEHITIKRDETTFNGRVFIRETPVFSMEHYSIIAKCCLDWAISNPEKLAQS